MHGEECSEAELILWLKITLCSFKCVTLPPGGSVWSITLVLASFRIAYLHTATLSAVCILCTVCRFSECVEHCVPQCNVPPIFSGRNEPETMKC